MNFKILFFLFFALSLSAQSDIEQLSYDQYLDWVREHHPVMQRARLLDKRSAAQGLEARGSFDPKAYADYDAKAFDKKNYYRVGEAGFKIPTWMGVDVKLAYNWTNGQFLNSERTLPSNGQAIIGVDIPIGKGLFFDQRRAQINNAELLAEMNDIERKNLINDLILDASIAYWNWVYFYEQTQIQNSFALLARDRFEIVRQSFLQGDKPAIDTLEANITIQNRLLAAQEARIDFENAGLDLSTYLWLDNRMPLQINPDLIPADGLSNELLSNDRDNRQEIDSNLINNHPQILQLTNFKLQLENKQRLNRENLKPQLDFSYNLLGAGFDFDPAAGDFAVDRLFNDNYKIGVQFEFPLLLRKERGKLNQGKVKLMENETKIRHKKIVIENKIQVIENQIDNTFQQLELQQNIIEQSQQLLDAEYEKFRLGESSLFLINSREAKFIQYQLKRLKMLGNYNKLLVKREWSKGILN